MITADDLAEVVSAHLRTSDRLAAAAPGGCWYLRAEEGVPYPYVVFGVDRAGASEWVSDGSYLQAWTVRVGLYTAAGEADEQAGQIGVGWALNTDPTEWFGLRDGAVFEVLPEGWDGEFTPDLARARDVFLAGGQWAVLVDGNREP